MLDSDSNMKAKLKKVEEFLENKFIFCSKNWLKEKVEINKTNNKLEDKIYQEVLQSDIETFIDKDRVKNYFNLNQNFKFENKKQIINSKIFFQIKSYSNIAEPKIDINKGRNNLDVLENFENKYLESEDEKVKKIEKVLLKFELTNGVETVFGFEYEELKEIKTKLKNEDNENKFHKLVMHNNFEVRRGIILMRNNNTILL